MLRVFAALSLVTGCFAPDPTTGAPCAAGVPQDERCPDGQFCIQHDGVETCETSDIPDQPGGDRDRDGIIDLLDNCPDVANLDQADEDRDRAGDVCDPCPPFAGVDDADGDGVGDACDPNPSIKGDKLLAFTGFASMPAGWTTSGQFITSGGEGLATSDDTQSAVATFAAPATGKVEVRAAARLFQITAKAPNLGAVNVVDRFLPADDRGVACQLSTLETGDQQQLRIFDLDKKVVVDTAPHVIDLTVEVDLRLRRADTQYNCRATNPVLELAGTVAFAPPSPRAGVRVRGVTALFHWVMIVTSP